MLNIFIFSNKTFSSAANCNQFAITAPYIGINSKALVVSSLYNQDIVLLKKRETLPDINQYCPPALFEISGMAIGTKSPNLYIDTIEFDIGSYINDVITPFVDFAYKQVPPAPVNYLGDTKAYLDRIFIILGNLKKSPFYLTLGRRYVPFGQYDSFMISGSLAQPLGKTLANSLLIGYNHPGSSGMYNSIYLWSMQPKLFWGITNGYEYNSSKLNVNIGIDYIESITAAEGLQNISTSDVIPGLDLHAKIVFQQITLLAEYTQAIKHFQPMTLSYYAKGANPSGVNIEVGYILEYFSRKSSIALGYGFTNEAAELGLPKHVLKGACNISLSPNLIFSVEYKHNFAYSSHAVNSSQTGATLQPSANAILARLIAYF